MATQIFKERINQKCAEFVLKLTRDQFYERFPFKERKGRKTDPNGFEDLSPKVYHKLVREFIEQHKAGGFTPLAVTYKPSSGNPRGRLYSREPMSVQRLHYPLRVFLTEGIFHDYDMVNAHPTILCNLCEQAGLETMWQNIYLNNREGLLKAAGFTYDDGKAYMLALMNTDGAYFPKKKSETLYNVVREWNTNKQVLYNNLRARLEGKSDSKNPISSVINKRMCEVEMSLLHPALAAPRDADKCLVPMFDGFMTEDPIDLETLPKSFVQWKEKPIVSDVVVEENIHRVVIHPVDAAEVMLYVYPHVKFCLGDLYVYDTSDGVWHQDNKNIRFRRILIEHKDILMNERDKSYGVFINLQDQVHAAIKSLTVDDEWLSRVDRSSFGKLLFKNGIYDFKTKKFSEGFDPNIVFFEKISRDFPKRDEDFIQELDKIFFRAPFTQEQIDEGVPAYFKYRLAKGLAADYIKDFSFMIGKANSGKSMLVNHLIRCFGGYIGCFNGENLRADKKADDAATCWRWALLCRHKRLMFSQEASQNIQLNGGFIKKLSGKDELTGRVHCGLEKQFIPHFHCVYVGNDMQQMQPCDGGVRLRGRLYEYLLAFVCDAVVGPNQVKADLALDEKLCTPEYIDAFTHLILDSYSEDNLSAPAPVLAAFQDYTKGQSVAEQILESFEITQDKADFVTNDEFNKWRAEKGIKCSPKQFAQELGALGAQTGGKRGGVRVAFFIRWRVMHDSDEESLS